MAECFEHWRQHQYEQNECGGCGMCYECRQTEEHIHNVQESSYPGDFEENCNG